MQRLQCGLKEIKFAGDSTETNMTFHGYGAVFGNVDSYGDVIAKGAFIDSLRDAKAEGVWPAMLEQHGGWGITAGDMTPIGVWTDLEEDDIGLAVKGKFAPTARGAEMYALMKMTPRPAINGLSIGYIPKEWSNRAKPEEPRRTLKKVHLIEVSPVTFPANGKARVTDVKSADFTERIFEEMLMQDAGFSRNDARVVINQGFKSLLAMRDAGSSELDELAAALKANINTLKS